MNRKRRLLLIRRGQLVEEGEMPGTVMVRICRICEKVKRFEEWKEQPEILKEEIKAGRIQVKLDTCDDCLRKVSRSRSSFK